MSCLNIGKVASALGAFGVNQIWEALGYCSHSAFRFAIDQVMISGTHVGIHFDISHELYPEGEVNLGSLSVIIQVAKRWTEKIISMRS